MAGRCLEVGVCYKRDSIPPVQHCKLPPLSKTFLNEGSRKTFQHVKADVEQIIAYSLPAGTSAQNCVEKFFVPCGTDKPTQVSLLDYVVAEEVGPRLGGPGVDLWVVVSDHVPLEQLGYPVRSCSASAPSPPPERDGSSHGSAEQESAATPAAAAAPDNSSPADRLSGPITAQAAILFPGPSPNEPEACLVRPLAGLSGSEPAASAAHPAPAARPPPTAPVNPPQTTPRATAEVPAPRSPLPDTPATSETPSAAAVQEDIPSPQPLPSGPSAFGTVPNVPCPISDAIRPIRKSQQAANPSQQRPPLKRQVFISHTKSDEDAGRRFAASTLRPALLHAGVSVFMDYDSIKAGEDWGWSLIDNAANSAVVVLVLSRSFLTRYWCMLELDLALNAFRGPGKEQGLGASSTERMGPVVIPVLYDDIVDDLQPEERNRKRAKLRQDVELRWSNPQNAEMLVAGFKSEHEMEWGQLVDPKRWMKNVEHVVDRLQRMWLRPVAELVDADWQLARQVTARVLEEIQPVEGVDRNLAGFEHQLDELEKVVMQPRNGGWGGLWLYGMGGSGKTTMAALLFNKLACQFERRAFVRIPFGASEDVVAQLVPEALKRLGPSVASAAPSTQLRDFAAVTEKVLYVLDNVQSGTQLDHLLPEDWGAGSVVIVTSRCNAFRDGGERFNQVELKPELKFYRVNKLDTESARLVFRRQMFGFESTMCLSEDLLSVEDGILECCDGLPLALKVMGDQLKPHAKTMHLGTWKAYLSTLRQGVVPGMRKLLSIVHDSLSRRAPGFMDMDMDMFLDVATILNGIDRTWALDIWETLHRSVVPIVRLYELERLSLLHIEDNRMVMHRMLMIIGRGLCLHRQGQLKECCHGTRIWVDEGQVAGHSEAAKAGKLRMANPEDFLEAPADALPEPSHMNVFWLDHTGVLRRFELLRQQPLKWDPVKHDDNRPLRVLSAEHWVKEPLNLAVVVAASHDNDMDQSIRATATSPSGRSGGPPTPEPANPGHPPHPPGPPNLDSATAQSGSTSQPPSSTSSDRTAPPATTALLVASSASHPHARADGNAAHQHSLYELVIRRASQATVWIRDAEELEQLLLSANAPVVHGLNLTACWRLQKLPSSFGQVTGLLALNMCGCVQLAALPQSFGRLAALQSLKMRHCKQLTALPESFGQLKMLQVLDLSHCELLASLPDSFGQLAALKAVDLSNCYAMTLLPESFGSLACLKILHLSHCTQLGALPGSLSRFEGLGTLHLVGCTSLPVLPPSIGNLHALKELDLSDCRLLAALPESFASMRALRMLALVGCVQLAHLPHSHDWQLLPHLEVLDLTGCKQLAALPESCGRLVALRTLSLSGCSLLTELPSELGFQPVLERLDLSWCSKLAFLPSTISGLTALRELDLTGCISLEGLPDSFGALQLLHTVSIRWCKSLAVIPKSFGSLAQLRHMDIRNCKSLQSLPTDFLKGLTCLQNWELCGCTLLSGVSLWPLETLAALQGLHLADCVQLSLLPESIGRLAALRVLDLAGCLSLSALPESLGQLLSLELLDLSGCKQLAALPQSFGQLAALRVLLIRGCQMLASLPESIGSLGALKVLELVGCHSLHALPKAFHRLQLRTLVIQNCPGIQVLAEGLGLAGCTAATNAGLQLLQSCARLQPRPQVFLSCAAHDPDTKQFATSVLKAALEAAGLQVAMDHTSCEGDFQRHEQLVDAAANSAVVVPVLSQAYGQQFWCMLELDAALHSHSLLQVASDGATAQPLVLPVFFDAPHKVVAAARKGNMGTALPDFEQLDGRLLDGRAAALASVAGAARWEGNMAAMAEVAQHIRRTDCYDQERDLQLAQRLVAQVKKAMQAPLALFTDAVMAGPSHQQERLAMQPLRTAGVVGQLSLGKMPCSSPTVGSPPRPSSSQAARGSPPRPSSSQAARGSPPRPSSSQAARGSPPRPSSSQAARGSPKGKRTQLSWPTHDLHKMPIGDINKAVAADKAATRAKRVQAAKHGDAVEVKRLPMRSAAVNRIEKAAKRPPGPSDNESEDEEMCVARALYDLSHLFQLATTAALPAQSAPAAPAAPAAPPPPNHPVNPP